MRSTLVVILFALGLARAGTAQSVPPGTRVRLTTPASYTGWHVGRVSQMSRDSVRIVYATGESASIALGDVGLMDMSSGSHTPAWATLSSVVTVPTGALSGILGAMATSVAKERALDTYMEQGFWIGAGTGLLAGIVIAVTNKTEDWSPVMLPATGVAAMNPRPASAVVAMYRLRMRVKLHVNGQKLVGTLVDQNADSIFLAWNSGPIGYSRASVTDVKVSRGRSAWTGAKFGALVGGGIGLVRGLHAASQPNDAANDLRDPDCDDTMTPCRYESDVVTATKSVTGYALLGALFGAVIRRERWDKTELPSSVREGDPPRLLFAPSRGGVSIGLHATF